MFNRNLPAVFSLLAVTSISARDKFTYCFLYQGGIKCSKFSGTNKHALG
jgi:hypothetical protein